MKILVIACSVMKDELKALSPAGVQLEFMDIALHRTPLTMPHRIQEKIHQADSGIDYIVLGYGLCGNGVLGVRAEKQPLVVPLAHDCIGIFLGSSRARHREQDKAPGTYYLTRGWIDEGINPLALLDEYTQRYGREKAEWSIDEEFRNYNRLALLDTGIGDLSGYRKCARANAAFLKADYEEIRGSSDLLEKLVSGAWDKDNFVVFPPGEEITQRAFWSLL